jgi:hypothetical protein
MAIYDYGVKAILAKALAATPKSDALAALAERVESNLPAGSAEKLDFLGHVPALRKWEGKRSSKSLIPYNYTVTLEKFEATFDVTKDMVNNDKTGTINKRAGELAMRYNPQWAASRVAALINAAESALCFDGKSFFATDHSWGDSGTLDNDITFNAGTHTAPTAYECAQALVAAINQFQSFKDDQGQPINEGLSSVTVVCKAGTALAAAMGLAVSEATLDTGTGVIANPVKGLQVVIKFLPSTRITLTDKFAVVNTTPGACPFAFLENKADFAMTMKGAGSDFEHDNDKWEYGIKAVGEAGYGLFTDAVLCTLT